MSSSSTPTRWCSPAASSTQKIYYHHTGYHGGIKERTRQAILDGRFPERVLEKAVRAHAAARPAGPPADRNLRVYKGAEHPHDAQNPESLDVAAMNPKNVRSD